MAVEVAFLCCKWCRIAADGMPLLSMKELAAQSCKLPVLVNRPHVGGEGQIVGGKGLDLSDLC